MFAVWNTWFRASEDVGFSHFSLFLVVFTGNLMAHTPPKQQNNIRTWPILAHLGPSWPILAHLGSGLRAFPGHRCIVAPALRPRCVAMAAVVIVAGEARRRRSRKRKSALEASGQLDLDADNNGILWAKLGEIEK